jgi:hypothetical protein
MGIVECQTRYSERILHALLHIEFHHVIPEENERRFRALYSDVTRDYAGLHLYSGSLHVCTVGCFSAALAAFEEDEDCKSSSECEEGPSEPPC